MDGDSFTSVEQHFVQSASGGRDSSLALISSVSGDGSTSIESASGGDNFSTGSIASVAGDTTSENPVKELKSL